ncbi:MAG: chromosomal replication initiator protein DnaA [Xanthomonadales bacterium]|nr:chromosomal replication initiator protein DnaA [Xanthomonadales bacterium]
MADLWQRCLRRLEGEISAEDLHTWLSPLQADLSGSTLTLYAANVYVAERVEKHFAERIGELGGDLRGGPLAVRIKVGMRPNPAATAAGNGGGNPAAATAPSQPREPGLESNVDPRYTFDNFVEGKSNELGKAAALQIALQPGEVYNPLLLYGGTGLGKTHLLHAAGNLIRQNRPDANVVYQRSEQFVSGMIRALRSNRMDEFKRQFRSVDALLIDDIQFFAGKDRTQEEFFHTFNALFESKQQIVLTCDRYPKEVDGLEPRLKSRFGWGLNVAIEPPDFETRVSILMAKAQSLQTQLPDEVAMLIARRMRSNVRELEGALHTLSARANLSGRPVTLEFAQEALRDHLSVQERLVSIGNIQKTVADYYGLRQSDMTSERRQRSVVRPRQMAMALAKELTEHSLPEIGDGFGGRDHTTVLHACRVMRKLVETDGKMREDWDKLIRTLTG